MAYLMHDPGGRYRQRSKERRQRIFLTLLAAGLLGGLSYWRGAESVRSNEAACKQQSVALQQEKAGFEQTITSLRSEAQSAQIRYQQLEEKYQQDTPSGVLRQLTDLIRKQLAAGIKPERLVSVIEAARPPKNCSEPSTKRFVMRTPVYSGPHGSVTFANGAITVSGEGTPAVSPAGTPEAWYDAGKPVTITFTEAGGKDTVKTGLLPIQHSIVLASKEYRFTVAAGERSFITVTADSCDYP